MIEGTDVLEKNIIQFRNYLICERIPRLKPLSINTYYDGAKSLVDWLADRNLTLATASDSHIREWARINEDHYTYFYGAKEYCKFLELTGKEMLLEEIKKKLPPPSQTSTELFIDYNDFKRCFSAEKSTTKQWQNPYLYLLWTEMEKRQINGLLKSDISFVDKTINVGGKPYYATTETWEVLKRFVKEEDRGKKEKLFPLSSRCLRSAIQEYFEARGLNAQAIRRSCKEEIIRYGRMAVFVVGDDQRLMHEIEKKKNQKRVIEPDLFKQVIDEIYAFGIRMASRIEGLKGQKTPEKTLQRLLEGYLVGRFPQQSITPEFTFEAWKDNSRIDFTMGEIRIPIEIKVCTKPPIGDCIRDGFAQVKEYLNRQEVEKGIVVIGDTTKNLKHRRHSKHEDDVEIVII